MTEREMRLTFWLAIRVISIMVGGPYGSYLLDRYVPGELGNGLAMGLVAVGFFTMAWILLAFVRAIFKEGE